MKVTLNYKNALSFVSEEALNQNKENVLKAYKTLVNKTGEGNDFLGWIEYPKNYDKEEFARIKRAAEKIRSNSEVLVVIGIGGSYLGAKAVIEALKPYFSKNLNKLLPTIIVLLLAFSAMTFKLASKYEIFNFNSSYFSVISCFKILEFV